MNHARRQNGQIKIKKPGDLCGGPGQGARQAGFADPTGADDGEEWGVFICRLKMGQLPTQS
jgi:hypothetical protein